jgi:hypothetical protein
MSCNDFLLDESHKPVALRQDQTQVRDFAKVTGVVDYHHVDALTRSFHPGLHQAQNPSHPYTPAADMIARSYPVQPTSPNLATVP